MDIFAEALQRGIETSFVDATGQTRTPSVELLKFLLDRSPSMQRRWLDAPQICHRHDDCSIYLHQHDALEWRIENHGSVVASGDLDGDRFSFPKPKDGIYQLRLRGRDGYREDVPLICSPEKSFGGTFDKVWLLAIQLYSVRSSRNWGIGDFTDLAEVLTWVAKRGGAGVGLNPLHVLFDDCPDDCSPYAPNSRLFLNPLYIDVEQLPEMPKRFVVERADAIAAARSETLVDYNASTKLKREALQQAFIGFKAAGSEVRKSEFEKYKSDNGKLLFRFACFEVLRKKFKQPWWEWPGGWSRPDDRTLRDLEAGDDKAEIEFVQYVQWCADQQLKSCQDMAKQLGMAVGLYLDIAVGVKPDGFDAWNEQEAIERELSVGAPPDILNTEGQDWGLAGYSATGLQSRCFQPFVEMLSASMRYAGAIRLDHVLGLNRLYLVPAGMPADQGTYVRMPLEAFLATIAIESNRNACVVIGEDLGTVPDGLREALAKWGIWSYRVMMFERGHDGAFLHPDQYPDNSLATFGTHDLPTYRGWLVSHDLQIKQALGVDPGESHDARSFSHTSLATALRFEGNGLPDVYSMLQFLAETRSRLLVVSIEDLLSVVEQVNVPGTTNQYPNWRRRLHIELRDWSQAVDEENLTRVMIERCR